MVFGINSMSNALNSMRLRLCYHMLIINYICKLYLYSINYALIFTGNNISVAMNYASYNLQVNNISVCYNFQVNNISVLLYTIKSLLQLSTAMWAQSHCMVVPDAYYKYNGCNRHRQFTLGLTILYYRENGGLQSL